MRAQLSGLIGRASLRAAVGLAVCCGAFSYAAAADTATPPYGTTTWAGLNWGIGLAADFDLTGKRVVDADNVNGIVRVTNSSSNVGVGFVLEAHYFLRDWPLNFNNAMGMKAPGGCFDNINCSEVALGPFVAIEVGNGSASSPDPKGLVTAYGLGAMVGLHHPVWEPSKTNPHILVDTSTRSWNLGVGLRIDPSAKVLGDGLIANQPVPAGDSIRFKTEPRLGVMLVSSFSF